MRSQEKSVSRDPQPVAPSLSVVVIGRNEEANLDRCFASVRNMRYPAGEIELIYVDSASSDHSREIAHRWGAKLIALDGDELGAARAREAGRRSCSAPYILFLDGDCTVEPNFVRLALPEFREPRVASVYGTVRERNPERSFYHRANNLLWQGFHLGEGPLRGGNHLVRQDALAVVGGFNHSLLTKENVDLGIRLIRHGYVSLRLDIPMVVHDLGRFRWQDFLRRALRSGYGNAIFFAKVDQGFQWFWLDAEFALQVTNSVLFLVVGLGAGVALLVSSKWFLVWVLVAPSALLLVQMCLARKKSRHLPTLLLYALHEIARSLAVMIGHLWFIWDRLLGQARFPVEWRRIAEPELSHCNVPERH